MDERRKNEMCYSCDAKWSRGHVCDALKLFLIEEVEEDSIIVEEIVEKAEEDPEKKIYGPRTRNVTKCHHRDP
jgi:hypothetical protein